LTRFLRQPQSKNPDAAGPTSTTHTFLPQNLSPTPAKISRVTTKPKTRWAWTLGTFFGAGYLKPGPGTYGSVAAALLWYIAAHIFAPSPATLIIATAVAALIVTLGGIPASTIVARESGRKDPGFVVIDEVVGQLFALILMRPTWQQAVLALLLFRLFDIWKPFPIRRLEALPEGTGIMLDDVAAGLLALLVGLLITHLPHGIH
jgi:phosphatidylglycerophosphatase A